MRANGKNCKISKIQTHKMQTTVADEGVNPRKPMSLHNENKFA